jgi:monooxygenase
VDGEPVRTGERHVYKGMMIDGVPNLLAIFGYTNASWTLKADIVCEHFVRMIAHMDAKQLKTVTPRARGIQRTDQTVMGSLASGYVRRGADKLPRQGDKAPWTVLNDYLRDAAALKLGSVTNKALVYAA